VLIDDYAGDVGGNPMDDISSGEIIIREKINVVGDQLCLNVLMVFKPSVIFHSNDGYSIVHFVLDGRSMKERSIMSTLFQPGDSQFLFPEHFILLASFFNLGLKLCFFVCESSRATFEDDLLLKGLYVLFQSGFG
jgi:hypothetical protein